MSQVVVVFVAAAVAHTQSSYDRAYIAIIFGQLFNILPGSV